MQGHEIRSGFPVLIVGESLIAVLVVGGFVALLVKLALAARSERHLEHVPTRISCPRRGADVECTMLRDERTGKVARLSWCSGSHPEGAPTCDQNCVRLMNLGIPLKPEQPPRRPWKRRS